jgi:hypothetical protein
MTKPVVSTREANLYHDSYFYATYQNVGKQGIEEFEEVMIGSTAFSGGHYNEPITASNDVIARWANEWLPLKSKYDNRNNICKGAIVYAPNARKYKSCGIVMSVERDRFDPRETVVTVQFEEGYSEQRPSKLVVLQPFIPEY